MVALHLLSPDSLSLAELWALKRKSFFFLLGSAVMSESPPFWPPNSILMEVSINFYPSPFWLKSFSKSITDQELDFFSFSSFLPTPAHLLFPHKRFLPPLLCREVHETSYGFRSWIVILCWPRIYLSLLENISQSICFRLRFPSSFHVFFLLLFPNNSPKSPQWSCL